MGFWDVTKRMIQGKPAFEAPQDPDDWDDTAPTTDYAEDRRAKRVAATASTSLVDINGNKLIPVATIHRVRTVVNRDQADVWTIIKNESNRPVFLDKITMLGINFELDYPLDPGFEREFRVYHGPLLVHDHYKTAEVYYRDKASGDYFRADHLLEYSFEPDKSYEIIDTKLISPIRDI